jgi:hypothetical protein
MVLCGYDGLAALGIQEGINEVVATTEKEGIVNAAPLGIIREGDRISVRLFSGSHTYDNVLQTGWLVANVTHDAWLFAETALEDLSPDFFMLREGVPVLKEAEAWCLFRGQALPLDTAIVALAPVKGEVLRKDLKAFNRGACLVVEAAVAATRYLALRNDSYLQELFRLQRIINRCGGPREKEAMDRLMDRIEKRTHI